MRFLVLAFLLSACESYVPPPQMQTYGVLLPACVFACKASVAATEAEGGGSATGVITSEPPIVNLP